MNSNLHALREAYIARLDAFDRDGAVQYALALLERGEITVAQLYEQILAPALNRIEIPRCDETCMIWREHVMSNIVRSTVEAAYPYVQKEREAVSGNKQGPLVALVCPQEEHHEIGLRMGADFFTIAGYRVAYIGCNTPRDTLIDAVKTLKPEMVGISVTNYLNLAQLPVLVGALKALSPAPAVYLSGSALAHTGKQAEDFGADGILTTFSAIQALSEGGTV